MQSMVALSLDKVQMGQLMTQTPALMPQVQTGPSRQKTESQSVGSTPPGPPSKPSKTDAYTTRDLCKTVMNKPVWNGKSLAWKDFMRDWNVYWSFQKELVDNQHKKWMFITCLPPKWHEHMKAYISRLHLRFQLGLCGNQGIS